jgi:hypothetical protein
MPANDGLGSDDRQGISKVRKQSIEADKYQPVEESLRSGAPQDNDLLPKNQNLGFK